MAENIEPEHKRLEIKKYPNRRYYDATHSRHLTLDEIRSLIRDGYDIQVTDAKTSTDITAQVLTQIILEFEAPKLDAFPVPLLVRVIRMNDQILKDFIEQYFNQALQSFFSYQKQIEEQVREAQRPGAYPSVTAWTRALMGPFASVFTPPSGPAAASAPSPAPASNPEMQQMIQRLQEQIGELQKQVAGAKKKPSGPSRRKR